MSTKGKTRSSMSKAELIAKLAELEEQESDSKPHFVGLITKGHKDFDPKYGNLLVYRPHGSDRQKRIGFRNSLGIAAAFREEGAEALIQTMLDTLDD